MADTPATIGSIFGEIQSNLYEANLRWYSSKDILDCIQDQYNKLVAIMMPIEATTLIPQIAEPYYNLKNSIDNYMYLVGLYNPATNLWLEGLTYKQMKATYQTYLAIGQPRWVNIVDFNRVLVWPYDPAASGTLFVIYKATAPAISMDYSPSLPYSSGAKLLEYFTTAELFEQAREFNKAKRWLDRAIKPQKNEVISIFDQCKKEVQDLARMDRERVLEPYRWIFHGGTGMAGGGNWVSNEVPTGTIDGSNNTFTLAQVPNPTASLMLTKNGQLLYQGIGYSLSGQTITFNPGYVPQTSGDSVDAIRAWYQVS